jgi:hypothetical protein
MVAALHGPAVVGMQDDLSGFNAFPQAYIHYQVCGQYAKLLLMHLPANNLSAVNIQHQIQV